jgi:hypothetical protein
MKVCVLGADGTAIQDRLDVRNAIFAEKPAVVVGTGHHAFPDGTEANVNSYLRPYWDVFSDAGRFIAVASTVENDTNAGEPFFEFTRGTPPRYFSRVVGDAEFFLFNTGFDSAGNTQEPDNITGSNFADSLQGVWLQNALANSTAKHKIVVLGHALRSSAATYPGGAGVMADLAVLPLRSWGADAVLAGNVFHYERLVDQTGLLQLNVGTGGLPLTDFGTIDAYSQVRIKQFGYVLATITPLHVLFEFKNVNGEVLDRVQI